MPAYLNYTFEFVVFVKAIMISSAEIFQLIKFTYKFNFSSALKIEIVVRDELHHRVSVMCVVTSQACMCGTSRRY